MTVDPWLSVVIPTLGRATLTRTLDSLAAQPESGGLEVLVVGDTFGGDTPALIQARDHVLSERDGKTYHWLEHAGDQHCFGQPQRTAGSLAATAPWVWFTQDDNVAAAGSLAAIRAATLEQEKARPLFFRWLAPWRVLIWGSQNLVLGNIDADCLVFPQAIAQQVQWGLRYEGDYDAAVQAVALAGGDVGWCDPVVSVARPHRGDLWWLDV